MHPPHSASNHPTIEFKQTRKIIVINCEEMIVCSPQPFADSKYSNGQFVFPRERRRSHVTLAAASHVTATRTFPEIAADNNNGKKNIFFSFSQFFLFHSADETFILNHSAEKIRTNSTFKQKWTNIILFFFLQSMKNFFGIFATNLH